MDEAQLRRIEDALRVYDGTHRNPVYQDGRDPISRDVSYLLAEVRRLRDALRAVARHSPAEADDDGALFCFFCDAPLGQSGELRPWDTAEGHDPACAWVAARALLVLR